MKKESLLLKIWRVIYPLLIWLLIANLAQLPFLAIPIFENPDVFTQADPMGAFNEIINKHAVLSMLIGNVIAVAVLSIFYLNDLKKEKNNPLNQRGVVTIPVFPVSIALAVFTFASGNLLVIGLNQLLMKLGFGDLFSMGFSDTSNAINSANTVIVYLSVVLFAPLAEELVMRGFFYKRMRGYCRALPAALVSAAVFGVVHGNIVQFLYAFFMGVILAYAYEYTNNLLVPIIIHVVANFCATIVSEEFMSHLANDLYFVCVPVGLVLAGACLAVIIILGKKRKAAIVAATPEPETEPQEA